MNIEAVAEICHEANRVYCRSLGDESQAPWADAPDWQRESAVNGVQFHLDNPDAGPEASHENWLREKTADGWIHGATKDAERKTHPCIMSFEHLPDEQRAKDHLFKGIVGALREFIEN